MVQAQPSYWYLLAASSTACQSRRDKRDLIFSEGSPSAHFSRYAACGDWQHGRAGHFAFSPPRAPWIES